MYALLDVLFLHRNINNIYKVLLCVCVKSVAIGRALQHLRLTHITEYERKQSSSEDSLPQRLYLNEHVVLQKTNCSYNTDWAALCIYLPPSYTLQSMAADMTAPHNASFTKSMNTQQEICSYFCSAYITCASVAVFKKELVSRYVKRKRCVCLPAAFT